MGCPRDHLLLNAGLARGNRTRHSLAEVGEGAVAVPVADDLCHLARAHAEDCGPDGLHLDAAPLTATAGVIEHQHSLIVQLTVLRRRMRLPVLPLLCEGAPLSDHLGYPSPASRFWAVGAHPLDIGVCPTRREVVPAFPFRIDRAHEVQVLGHCMGSIPQPGYPGALAGGLARLLPTPAQSSFPSPRYRLL